MTNASYVVVRYVADPARNEQLNVGVLAWGAGGHQLVIDGEAVARVIRENPRLHTDALSSLPATVTEIVDLAPGLPPAEIGERVAQAARFPVVFSEPRATTVADGDPNALGATVERLVKRIVTPRRRSGRGAPSARQEIERRVTALILGGRVQPQFPFLNTRTGVRRVVDFFVNSGSNVALDTVKLDLRLADEVRLRADAEAYKIGDIAAENPVEFLVLASLPTGDEMIPARDEALQILRATEATVLSDVDEAIEALQGAAGR